MCGTQYHFHILKPGLGGSHTACAFVLMPAPPLGARPASVHTFNYFV